MNLFNLSTPSHKNGESIIIKLTASDAQIILSVSENLSISVSHVLDVIGGAVITHTYI